MKLVLKKRLLLRLLAIVFLAMVFAIGWLYLDYYFNSMRSSFDFDLYLDSPTIDAVIGKVAASNAIVFSGIDNRVPVEVYVSNCPMHATCGLSKRSSYPTYITEISIAPSDLTPEGLYPVGIYAVGAGIRRTATLYVNVSKEGCLCTDWLNNGCGLGCGSDMYLTRECEPSGCDIESRCAYNSSCGKDFSMTSVPVSAITNNLRASFVINITSLNRFSDYVYFSTSSCPYGAVCKYSTSPVFVPSGGFATTELQVTASQGAVVGKFNIVTTGIAGDVIHLVNSSLTIT